jgi:hypothetical protein
MGDVSNRFPPIAHNAEGCPDADTDAAGASWTAWIGAPHRAVSLGFLLEGRAWALAIEVPRLLWLAVWPMLTARWPGHLWFAMNLRETFTAVGLLSLPGVIWAWWGTAMLQARAAH